jgi:hypothetical protein
MLRATFKTLAAMALLLLIAMVCNTDAECATFKSLRAAHDVALNTNPRAGFWTAATPVYFEADNHGHPVPWFRTTVRSRWTDKNLYLLFVCPYRKLNLRPSPSTTTETNGLWNWDVAEIFIGSDYHDIRRYKEFEISPQGEWTDLDINLDNPHHEDGWTWNSGFQVAARIDRKKKIWYGAMRIPLAAIDPKAPQAGSRLRVNLFRSQGPLADKKLLAWQAPMSDTFHVPERFGELEFIENP